MTTYDDRRRKTSEEALSVKKLLWMKPHPGDYGAPLILLELRHEVQISGLDRKRRNSCRIGSSWNWVYAFTSRSGWTRRSQSEVQHQHQNSAWESQNFKAVDIPVSLRWTLCFPANFGSVKMSLCKTNGGKRGRMKHLPIFCMFMLLY